MKARYKILYARAGVIKGHYVVGLSSTCMEYFNEKGEVRYGNKK